MAVNTADSVLRCKLVQGGVHQGSAGERGTVLKGLIFQIKAFDSYTQIRLRHLNPPPSHESYEIQKHLHKHSPFPITPCAHTFQEGLILPLWHQPMVDLDITAGHGRVMSIDFDDERRRVGGIDERSSCQEVLA